MIVKEKSFNPNVTDERQKAGDQAEQDMAYDLRRYFHSGIKKAFTTIEDIFIFNDLKLSYNGQIAQIDHLILYGGGFIIIESKSITGSALEIEKLNDSFQWIWVGQNKKIRIDSPVQQAKKQIVLLKDLLDNNIEKLLNKMLRLQTRFGKINYDIIIAASGTCVFKIANNIEIPELVTADSVVDKVTNIILAKSPSPLDIVDPTKLNKLPGFAKDEIVRIKDFLLLQDKKARNPNQFAPQAVLSHDDFEKFVAQQAQQPVAIVPEPQTIPKCPKCGAAMKFFNGKDGKSDFYGCSGFPKCRSIISINKE